MLSTVDSIVKLNHFPKNKGKQKSIIWNRHPKTNNKMFNHPFAKTNLYKSQLVRVYFFESQLTHGAAISALYSNNILAISNDPFKASKFRVRPIHVNSFQQ